MMTSSGKEIHTGRLRNPKTSIQDIYWYYTKQMGEDDEHDKGKRKFTRDRCVLLKLRIHTCTRPPTCMQQKGE